MHLVSLNSLVFNRYCARPQNRPDAPYLRRMRRYLWQGCDGLALTFDRDSFVYVGAIVYWTPRRIDSPTPVTTVFGLHVDAKMRRQSVGTALWLGALEPHVRLGLGHIVAIAPQAGMPFLRKQKLEVCASLAGGVCIAEAPIALERRGLSEPVSNETARWMRGYIASLALIHSIQSKPRT